MANQVVRIDKDTGTIDIDDAPLEATVEKIEIVGTKLTDDGIEIEMRVTYRPVVRPVAVIKLAD